MMLDENGKEGVAPPVILLYLEEEATIAALASR